MEAIPLPETSTAARAKALTFSWISVLDCLKQSLLIVGCNLLPTFSFNFAKFLTFHTNVTLTGTSIFSATEKHVMPNGE
jgi:hypothetical protein